MRNISSWNIEPFLVTVSLLGDLRINQRLPRVMTLWGVAVLPVSDLAVRIESLPACWWQWTWSVGRYSFPYRSWKRMCSSRSVTWSLVCQTQPSCSSRRIAFIFITTVSRVFPYTSFALYNFLRTLQQERTQSKLLYWLFFIGFFYFNCIVLHSGVR